jgi:hypothetical protein
MNEEANSGGAAGSENVGDSQPGKNSVKYETYKRTVDEVKSLKAELESFRTKESERESKALAEQGKFKEALDGALKEKLDLKQKLEAKEKSFAKSMFEAEAKKMALEFGAMPDALDDIVKVGDWSSVEIDTDNFRINSDQLKESMSKLQKEKSFFFKKNAQAPNDVHTSASGSMPKAKGLGELSKDEIMAQLKALK